MLVLGWLGGYTIKNYVSAYGQWIAFGLLVFIGSKMIYEAFYRKPEVKIGSLDYSVLLMLDCNKYRCLFFRNKSYISQSAYYSTCAHCRVCNVYSGFLWSDHSIG